MVAPVIPILQTQYAAYANRGIGLIPSQAGAGSSAIGGTISIYSVGANLIWAFFGYHADGAMVQIAALWPLLMLLGFVMLGRGRSGPSLLLLGLVVVPMAALFAIGSRRSDLFELRYFCGSVPAMLLLAARVLTATTVRKVAVVVTAGVLTAVMVVGSRRPAAQRRQPPPLRLQGRLRPHRGGRQGGRHRALRTGLPRRGRPLLRADLTQPRRRHHRARGRHGVGRRDREGAGREEQRGAARHRSSSSCRSTTRSPRARRSRTSPCGSWCRRRDGRRTRPATDPRLEPPTWHGDELTRPARIRATRAGGRQHARARRVLPVAAAAGPRRQPGAVRPAASSPSCSTSCRRWGSGGRAWPGRRHRVRAGPARPPPPPGRRRLHPDLQRAGRRRRADRDRRHRGCAAPRCASPCSTTATATRWSGWRCATACATSAGAEHDGAKAGNINHALGRTDAPFVLVLDCDHVPYPQMLERLLPEFVDPRVAYVQSPQYYANHGVNRLAGAAWSQQALFFGPIARGKDAHRSMICCGTNVVFRRAALDDVGGFPQGSLTEDFALSIDLHERHWESVYVPEPLASGFGPEDLAAVRQPAAPLGARLPRRDPRRAEGPAAAAQEAAVPAVGVVLPVRVDGGAVPGAADDPHRDRHPAARRLAGRHVPRRLRPVLRAVAGHGRQRRRRDATRSPPTRWPRRRSGSTSTPRSRCCGAGVGSFVVTPKEGDSRRQLRPAAPALAVIAVLADGRASSACSRSRDAATLNNVAFAGLHASVLFHGVLGAVAPSLATDVGDGTSRTSTRSRPDARGPSPVGSSPASRSWSSPRWRRSCSSSGAAAPSDDPAQEAAPGGRPLPRHLRASRTAVSCGPTRAATRSARARRTGC